VSGCCSWFLPRASCLELFKEPTHFNLHFAAGQSSRLSFSAANSNYTKQQKIKTQKEKNNYEKEAKNV